MSINKWEKISIAFVVLLFALAVVININNYKHVRKMAYERNMTSPFYKLSSSGEITNEMIEVSKKYSGFEELFEGEDTIIMYGYDAIALDGAFSALFNNKILKSLKDDSRYKIITYKNWREKYKNFESQHNSSQPVGCKATGANRDFYEYSEFVNKCLRGVCVFDNKNKKFTYYDIKNFDFILSELKNNN